MTRTIKLVVAYDGSSLCGFQRQINGPTVQAHLEQALESLHSSKTPIIGASRTDAGVHAEGQVASFQTSMKLAPFNFVCALNSKLPNSIAIVDAADASPNFHPRFDARGKRYRYRIFNRRHRSPFEHLRAWHWPTPLDLEAMVQASRHLVGEHDFSAFRAAGCSALHARRRIDHISLDRQGDCIEINVFGNAFLRNMVRIVVGTLAAVGQGALSPDQVPEILASRDRTLAGITAPPGGLTLMQVYFEGEYPQFSPG